MRKTCINPKLLRLTLEKMVIGVEEPILIKGIGELNAKIDSGNSGYNVIHGEDLTVQGNILTFKTYNKDNDVRRISKKIKHILNVNIGGGHIQERPVIELDVQFAGDDYKKVLFSVTDRGDNEHKVLISKDFVGKELNALIDVSKDNISQDNIKVDYVSEGVGNFIKSAIDDVKDLGSNLVKNPLGTIASGTERQQAFKNKWENRLQGMLGKSVSPETTGVIDKDLDDEVKAAGKLEKLIEEIDPTLIRNTIVSQDAKLKSLKVDVTNDNIAVFKILDYTGGTNNNEQNGSKEYRERLKKAFKAYSNFKNQTIIDKKINKSEENEEIVIKENTQQQSTQQNSDSSVSNQNNNTNNTNNTVASSPANELQGASKEKDISDMSEKEVEEILRDLQNRKRAIFYIINFKKTQDGNELTLGKDVISDFQPKINSWCNKIIQSKNWDKSIFSSMAADLAKDVEKDAKGLFALCTMPLEKRKVEFFTGDALFNGELYKDENEMLTKLVQEYQDLNKIYKDIGGKNDITLEGINNLIKNPTNTIDTLVQEYNQLNSEYLNIADDMGQSGDSININDLQALIDLADESSQNKRADELGQTELGDTHDAQDYSYHTSVESEERIVK